ncbi:MAG: FAD-dependent oxidoreductase [Nitrospirota bacterium]
MAHVIVIGAGFGGSSCAGLLAKRGLEVLLVEKNAQAGGKAMSLSRGDQVMATLPRWESSGCVL